VLDAFDALTSVRPYKAAMDELQAINVLLEETGEGKWDPAMMEAFLRFRETEQLVG